MECSFILILDSSSKCHVVFKQASAKFRWAARVVIVLSRVLKALVNYSADLIPETAAQRSFRTLRDNSEVKEILFNKSLYQRGKSVSLCLNDQIIITEVSLRVN